MYQFAQLGLNLVSSLNAYQVNKAAASAQATVDAANVKASNLLREGENEKRAAALSLNTYLQSLNNQRAMRAGGEQHEALSVNFARTLDASTRGALQEQVRGAEEMGRVVAQAAWSGVGGPTSAMIESTLRLRQTQQDAERDRSVAMARTDFTRQKAQLQRSVAEGLDYRYQLAGMDYGQDTAPYRAQPSMTDTALQFLAGNAKDITNAFASLKSPAVPGAPATKVTAPTTPVASGQFGKVVSSEFFNVGGPGGVGVNWQI